MDVAREMAKRVWPRVMVYGLWIGLSALAAGALWQLNFGLLTLAALLITSSLGPPGWTLDTLAGLNKLQVLVLGSFWLGLVMYMEHRLGQAVSQERLLPWALRTAGWLIALGILGYGLRLLPG